MLSFIILTGRLWDKNEYGREMVMNNKTFSCRHLWAIECAANGQCVQCAAVYVRNDVSENVILSVSASSFVGADDTLRRDSHRPCIIYIYIYMAYGWHTITIPVMYLSIATVECTSFTYRFFIVHRLPNMALKMLPSVLKMNNCQLWRNNLPEVLR